MSTMLNYLNLSPLSGSTTKDLFNSTIERRPTDYNQFNTFIGEWLVEKVKTSLTMCKKCNLYKPPRAHHCSKCDSCFLKMDHHCVWIDTCIGYHNYKAFLLFLVWLIIYSVYVILTLLYEIIFTLDKNTSSKVNYIIVCGLFTPILIFGCLLLGYHIVLLLRNETTIENTALNDYIYNNVKRGEVFKEGPLTGYPDSKDRMFLNPYNLGWKDNLLEVFGENWYFWILPIHTSKGDGIHFAKNYLDINDDELTFVL
jgi:palmitoyltransferase